MNTTNYGLSTHPRSVRSNQQERTREEKLYIYIYKKAVSKYGQKKKTYMEARAAFASLDKEDSVGDNESNTSKSESDSNATSIYGRNYSGEEGSDSS